MGNNFLMIVGIYVVAIAVIIFIFRISSRRQSAKKMALVSQLQVGAVVETIGGFRGTVSKVNEETIILKSAGTEIEFNSRAVGAIITPVESQNNVEK